ncbi:hypothetical protein HanHA89_Chr02g0049611 [Helianthus annuus]|nr:hypothetical protein HanHA89_Chr02g0049611 [Helianthus annuus]
MESFTTTREVTHLETDIHRFRKEHKVPEGMALSVHSSEGFKARWYKELSSMWPEKQPSPEEAAKLVFASLEKVNPHWLLLNDLLDFLRYYGLIEYYPLSTIRPSCGEDEDATDTPDDSPEDSKFCFETPHEDELLWLNTLPVSKDEVKDGRCFTVFVEVKRSYLLPSEILLVKYRLLDARVEGNESLVEELLQTYATQDYALKKINDDEVLTKKYEIQLIRDLPGTHDAAEAKELLARKVDGKCWMIKVFYIDEQLRCVGSVHCPNCREELFMKGCPSCSEMEMEM